MKKAKRKRYISLIFVPDQEQNPRSISMSYVKGRVLLVVAAVLVVHMVVGGFGYYRVFKLSQARQVLADENETLKVQNRKIEEIAEVHMANKAVIDKIYKAFGTQLGLSREEMDALSNLEVPSQSNALQLPAPQETQTQLPLQYQNRLPYLIEGKQDFFSPDQLPTRLPVEGFMTSRFQRGDWYLSRRHVGIDIAAERGTSIRASGSGVVIFADWTPDLGYLVVISHGRGYVSYYGHANHLLVEPGNRVKQGDVIALLGSSGISSAPHLHFEIWKDGEPLDPETFLYAIFQQSQDSRP